MYWVSIKSVEILPSVYNFALEKIKTFSQVVPEIKAEIEILNKNMTEIDWKTIDIAYIASTTFPEELMKKIYLRAIEMKIGSRVVTLKNPLPDENQMFKITNTQEYLMSWGMEKTIFQIKIK